MKFNKDQYKTLSERFNEKSFLGKVMLIKQNPELMSIESDGYNIRLRLLDDDAMFRNLDSLFSFPEFFSFAEIRDVFSLVDIKVKEL